MVASGGEFGAVTVMVRVAGLGESLLPGVANIGIRPTVEGDDRFMLEVHLFDFDREVYGQLVEVVEVHAGQALYQDLERLVRGADDLQDLDDGAHRVQVVAAGILVVVLVAVVVAVKKEKKPPETKQVERPFAELNVERPKKARGWVHPAMKKIDRSKVTKNGVTVESKRVKKCDVY